MEVVRRISIPLAKEVLQENGNDFGCNLWSINGSWCVLNWKGDLDHCLQERIQIENSFVKEHNVDFMTNTDHAQDLLTTLVHRPRSEQLCKAFPTFSSQAMTVGVDFFFTAEPSSERES